MMVLGLMLVAALNTVGAYRVGQQKVGERLRGMLLAQELMNEVLQQFYADPAWGLGSFGVGADETGTGDRSLYEDVDDYDGWTESPPERKDGTVIDGFIGWTREVVVDWVDPNDLDTTAVIETGVKRITVTVKRGDLPLSTLVAVRTADEGSAGLVFAPQPPGQ